MTRIYKSKRFNKFTRKERMDDAALIEAIEEVENGLFDADLGGQVYKKRIARRGQGKRSGYRTIILLKKGQRAFFAYGFPKNERENITDAEEEGFKQLAKVLLKLTDEELQDEVEKGEYLEVNTEEKEEEDGKEV